MPALTITAVDSSTNVLTIPAHGLTTGDGFLGIYTPNGTLPDGLVGTDNYWAIRTDDDHIRLATSSSNAMAGTAIDITSNGSGTLQLLRGLPYRVPRIAAPLTQIEPDDDNSAWLALVALWNFLTGQAQSIFTGIKLALNQNIELQGTGYVKHGTRHRTHAFTSGGLVVASGSVSTNGVLPGQQVDASSSAYFYLGPVNTLESITSVQLTLGNTPANAVTYQFYVATAGLGAASWTAVGAATVSAGTSPTVSPGGLYSLGDSAWIKVTTPAATVSKMVLADIAYDVP